MLLSQKMKFMKLAQNQINEVEKLYDGGSIEIIDMIHGINIIIKELETDMEDYKNILRD